MYLAGGLFFGVIGSLCGVLASAGIKPNKIQSSIITTERIDSLKTLNTTSQQGGHPAFPPGKTKKK